MCRDREEKKPLQVKGVAPEFTLDGVVGKDFRSVSLSDYKGKWVVLFFYPLNFTFVCPTEIVEFSRRAPEFEAEGAQILGVSVDSKYSHLAWIEHGLGELNFPLLADIRKETARDYGVLLEDAGIALRGAFIIDPDGVLRWMVVHDLGVGRSVDEVLRVLQSLKTGELCPVGWKPGQAFIKA
jgi:alkyl hydroperoxide reductase subunit AhpC